MRPAWSKLATGAKGPLQGPLGPWLLGLDAITHWLLCLHLGMILTIADSIGSQPGLAITLHTITG